MKRTLMVLALAFTLTQAAMGTAMAAGTVPPKRVNCCSYYWEIRPPRWWNGLRVAAPLPAACYRKCGRP